VERLEDRSLLSFNPITSYSVGTNPQAVVTADFNNDTKLDLATANAGSNSVSVRHGNGLGGLEDVNHFPTDPAPQAMTVGDFNHDGNLDLVTATSKFTGGGDANYISLLMGDGDGGFGMPINIVSDVGWQFRSVAAGDFNADGNMDLVYTYASVFEPTEVYSLLGDGQGGFELGNWAGLRDPVALAVADLNRDGKPEVITANQYEGTVTVLMGDHWLSTFDPDYIEFATGSSPRSVAIGDFTDDGIPDVATAGRMIDILPGLGDGTFAAPINHSVNSNGMTAVAAADFNEDGKLDIVTSDPGTGAVIVLLGNGNGTLGPPIYHAAGLSPGAVTVADFNADGQPDVMVANAGSNRVSVLLNDGDWSAPPAPALVSIGDVTKTEGKKGKTTLFTFTVTLSASYDQPVSLSYQTVNGTATTGNNDYVAKSGTLTFAPGETRKEITIEVKGDTKKEANETFYLDLLDLSTNALFTKNRGIGTILNDD
jgi:hypothetical protein